MANAVALKYGFSIRRVCSLFHISETTYHYVSKLNDNNERIAKLLLEITSEHRTWGFQLCYLSLNIIDDYNREALESEIDFSLPSTRVIRALNRLIECRSKPFAIRYDNGPEYISDILKRWARKNDIELWYIQPGNPQQNGYVEQFNRTM